MVRAGRTLRRWISLRSSGPNERSSRRRRFRGPISPRRTRTVVCGFAARCPASWWREPGWYRGLS